MLTFIFFAFLAYLLFKLVVDFVIPIYKTTQRVKKSFREMSARMNHPHGHEKMNGQSSNASAHQQNHKPFSKKKESSADYIDFEEVKD